MRVVLNIHQHEGGFQHTVVSTASSRGTAHHRSFQRFPIFAAIPGIAVVTPFHHVAVHVEQPKIIRPQQANRLGDNDDRSVCKECRSSDRSQIVTIILITPSVANMGDKSVPKNRSPPEPPRAASRHSESCRKPIARLFVIIRGGSGSGILRIELGEVLRVETTSCNRRRHHATGPPTSGSPGFVNIRPRCKASDHIRGPVEPSLREWRSKNRAPPWSLLARDANQRMSITRIRRGDFYPLTRWLWSMKQSPPSLQEDWRPAAESPIVSAAILRRNELRHQAFRDAVWPETCESRPAAESVVPYSPPGNKQRVLNSGICFCTQTFQNSLW